MADLKISQLPAATTPVAGTEVLPIVQSGTTKKVAISDVTAGRAVSATQYTSTITTGTAPLVVASTTVVANLNADLLDGIDSASFATLAGVETLTNKTLTSPKINENVALTSTSTKLNYLTSAGGTTGTASTNIVFSTSPTLVTPTLGVASATSLATSAASPLLLTNGQLATVTLTSQTVGGTTLTIPDFASVSDEFTFKTKSQTMSNKTFVAPALGTPASGVLSSCTGYAQSSLTGLGSGVSTFLGTPSSANLGSALTDKTGTGVNVFATSPTLTTPTIGVATATSVNFGGGALSVYIPRTAWTPVLAFGGASVGITYSQQVGWYIQIGDLVYFGLSITLTSKGSSSGNATITGLAKTANATGSNAVSTLIAGAGATVTTAMQAAVLASGTAVSLYKMAAGSNSSMTDSDFGASTVLYINGMYSV